MRKNKTFKAIWEIFNKQDNFLLITHKNPDGDAIGSLLGLYYFLREKGKNVYLFLQNGIPYSYQFLIFEDLKILRKDEDIKFEIAIFLDCGDIERIGEEERFINKIPIIINIDHHPTNTFFGNFNFVDPSAASVTEIITAFLLRNKENISLRVAQCLLTGLITDTGNFRFNNTSIRALKTAIKLLEKGANISYISQQVYERKTIPSLYLLGRALLRLKLENGIGYSYITLEDMEELNGKIEDTEGIVDTLRTLKDAEIITFLYPSSSTKTKVSLRSKSPYIDVGNIAKKFGGGGHKEAAGFEREGRPEILISSIVKELKSALEYESLPIDK